MVGNSWHFERKRVHRSLHTPKPGIKAGSPWHFERKRVHRSLHTPKVKPGVKVGNSWRFDFRSGCRNVSHHYRQQSFSGLHSPGRSNYTITCYPRVQTIYCTKSPVILSRRSAAASFLCIFVPRDSSSNVPRTKTIDSRMLKFDNLIITNIRASRFHTSLQGPFAEKKKWLSHHDNFLIMSLTGVKDRIQMRKKN